MNVLRYPLSLIVALCAILGAKCDDTVDSDGYPVMYLRGEMTNNWSCQNAYRFTRSGDVYSLTVSSLSGQFKISGTEWRYNLGASDVADANISSTCAVTGCQGGANFKGDIGGEVTIKFRFETNGNSMAETEITFTLSCDSEPDVPQTDRAERMLSGTLPFIRINVYKVNEAGEYILDGDGNRILDNEIISKDLDHKNYFKGEYWLDPNGCQWLIDAGTKAVGSAEEPLPLEIKARGNWTRIGFAKKPFKLKLGKKQNLMGLTPDKSKHYALLAHADDNYGYLRNFTGFNLGHRMGLPWTPGQQPVEVIINNDYRGLYFLTESIRVGDGRVPIEELKDDATDPALISGGYLVELDNYDEENQIRMTEKACVGGYFLDMLRVTWDTPESYSPIQKRFITEQFSAINDLVGANSDELWSYLDLDDLARYYIVREIISDVESFHGSTYLFRDRGEGQKWHFSPLWDCGNAFNGSTNQYFFDNSPYGNTWIPSISRNARFKAKVAETWKWFMSECYNGLTDDIDAICANITAATAADRTRWKDAPCPNGGTWVVDNTDMAARKQAVLNKLREKTDWLASQWGSYQGSHPEPARDTTPAAPLPEYAQSGVESVAVDAASGLPAEYFDLMGRRVSAPAEGSLYIVRQGDRVTKQVYNR